MKKITPFMWFDKQAKRAAEFYVSLLPNSKITHITTLHDTPSGNADVVSFSLSEQPFMALNGGPLFNINPSISFQIICKKKEETDMLWQSLIQGGKILMPLEKYPFSEWYGWVQDRYGVSWQVTYVRENNYNQHIIPVFLFVGKVCGKTEEAVNFYSSVFPKSNISILQRYGSDSKPEKEGTIQYCSFVLDGMRFGAMDSAREHDFAFNQGISLLVPCDTQDEIDYYWEKLSSDPESEQCGWLKDKYGVSWQVYPVLLGEMMEIGTRNQIDRVTRAFLSMKKFDINKLQIAFDGV